ncbi:ABC-F family ATP-binding cassette domain-containing protein [Pediococcus ethanolidurans]|uniref:ABC-F family ATP-binding cassette domain-containing protein n=1 Tax=Pediococcus ethanolidurans TaxID=319653 RepID=UPI001C1EFAE8|nr:ABC-F family ATP-binding cassette domain-containing protein [Pediococcus ethanolidurans]MBU7563934.1 ABC-F family ATP-binding cassette domain-containing protein [Pediococcus ethanolidurans]MCT4397758.1 ABC transporter ATP-binding protein [Pediococcus ethanolidurans]MCV3321732.1 ABC-F family ATP-binding cassette domain-containing protein [Pediococcus ethanolidurans]MCV3324173.1 ABC-F family ATP-binding cassette domain-containing protein [Pediococcus ethanolidurans]MCV3327832.1 ABC-F family A
MQTLKAEDLTETYGTKVLFQKINFLINEQDRIGLIGTNGTGKTSLLNVLAKVSPQDSGQIETPKNYTVGYLRQTPTLDANLTILDAIFAGSQRVFKTIRFYERALANYSQAPENEENQRQFEIAEQQMNQEDAWTAESDVKTILTQLHITNLNQKIGTLSGGQQKRVDLAQTLIQAPDLLMLDEPTNHLDFDSIAWLEQYLTSYKGALLIVTHDRYFLDRVANQIWELSFGKLRQYPGNYQAYVTKKATQDEQEAVQSQKEKRLYKQELAWMKRGPQGRGTKQQARINRFETLSDSVNAPAQSTDNIAVQLGQQRLGKKVIELKHASLNLGSHIILKDFSELIQADERVGITGNNGTGKSTLLKVIAKLQPLDSGIIDIGETVKLGYYTQKIEPIPEDKRIISYLSEVGSGVLNTNGEHISVTNLLEQFLFPRSMHGTLIRKLSGGEKRRLYLLKILMQQPNVLLLDEPTNDLDIGTLTVLEDYLAHFNGTVITVSHDRYFLNKVAEHLLIFEGQGKINRFTGLFTDYLHQQNQTAVQPDSHDKNEPKATPKKVTTAAHQKKKLTYAEQLEWQHIESDIDNLENKKADLQKQMNDNSEDYGKLADLQKNIDNLDSEIDEKMTRWEYLSQYVDD